MTIWEHAVSKASIHSFLCPSSRRLPLPSLNRTRVYSSLLLLGQAPVPSSFSWDRRSSAAGCTRYEWGWLTRAGTNWKSVVGWSVPAQQIIFPCGVCRIVCCWRSAHGSGTATVIATESTFPGLVLVPFRQLELRGLKETILAFRKAWLFCVSAVSLDVWTFHWT